MSAGVGVARQTPAGMRRRLRVLITSGPTREAIDAVRFISNYSTGYMGAQLAQEALRRGHRVAVISGPSTEALPVRARVIPVESARDMERVLYAQTRRADVIIMAAAVADFYPVRRHREKLSRGKRVALRLRPTPDLLAHLPRRDSQVIVGFALETGRVIERAARKLRDKRADVILAQRARRGTTPFGRHQVEAWVLERMGHITPLGRASKTRVARVLLDKAEALWYGQRGSHQI